MNSAVCRLFFFVPGRPIWNPPPRPPILSALPAATQTQFPWSKAPVEFRPAAVRFFSVSRESFITFLLQKPGCVCPLCLCLCLCLCIQAWDWLSSCRKGVEPVITSIIHVDPQFPSPDPSIYFTAHPLSPASTCDLRLQTANCDKSTSNETPKPHTVHKSPSIALFVSHPTRATAAAGRSQAGESRVIFVAEGLSHLLETPQKAGLLFITRVA